MTKEQIEQAAREYALPFQKLNSEIDFECNIFTAVKYGAELRQPEIDELKNLLRVKNDELRMLKN